MARGLVTTMEKVTVDVSGFGVVESVAVTPNGKEPACVGVPVSWPETVLRLRPVGSFPELTDQRIGADPPVDARVVVG
jgi:hypothetical protein